MLKEKDRAIETWDKNDNGLELGCSFEFSKLIRNYKINYHFSSHSHVLLYEIATLFLLSHFFIFYFSFLILVISMSKEKDLAIET